MIEQRFVVTDHLWEKLEPLLPGKQTDSGVTAKDNRLFFEAVLWRVRTGSPWRDLPEAFGPTRKTRGERFARAFLKFFQFCSSIWPMYIYAPWSLSARPV